MQAFKENRPYIENEFEHACFDPSTGLSAQALFEELSRMQAESGSEPRPLERAKAFSFILDHVQLQINPHTPFSVKLNLGVDYSYFAKADVYQKTMFGPQRKKILEQYTPDEYKKMKQGIACGIGNIYTDFWHTCPDWNRLLKLGFPGILQEAVKARSNPELEPRRQLYLDGVITCFEAVLRLLNRIYEYSLKFPVPEFSACIKKLTEAPPETLYDVMQFAVLYLYVEEIGCERVRTLGPIDRMYLPYYQKDLANGTPAQQLQDLFRYFFIHFTAAKRYAQQPLTLCGSDDRGNDRSTELSLRILQIYDELNIYDPKIHLRYHKNLDPAILEQVLKMIRGGNSSICIANDEAIYAGYERLGIPKTDAQDYVLLGCYEPVIMGKEEAEIAPAWLNLVKFLEFAINGGRDLMTDTPIGTPCTEPKSFEELFDLFLQQLDDYTEFALDYYWKQGQLNTMICPSPIYSASFAPCMEKGMDVHEYPLKYNNLTLKFMGLATCTDALVAIEKYVFDKKLLSLSQLRQILKDNWQGQEQLRNTVLRDHEKYGNNLPLPDSIACRITDHIAKKYSGRRLRRGGALRVGLDSITHCIEQGAKTAATADGRLQGVAVSKNLCATNGMDRGGITAYVQSVLKIDTSAFLGAAPLDFMLHPSAVEGEKGLEAFKSLLQVFFDRGGFAVQGNVVSASTLRKAQEEPEKYATLQIRVCGWNEYFVKLDKLKQDWLIKQSEGEPA